MMRIAEATPGQLVDWDARTVDVPGGNVYQSLARAQQRARLGWRPRFLVFDDGYRLLSLERPWKLIGGAGAYLSRGPVSAGEPVEQTAERLIAAAGYLADHGVDVVASDAEIEAASGYPALIRAAGFRPIEEFEPSRHRMALPLKAGAGDETAVFLEFATTTRQLIRSAERTGLRAVRFDARDWSSVGDGFEAPEGRLLEAAAPAVDRLYDLLQMTAARKRFALGPRAAFRDWSMTGLAAGHVVLLEARDADGETIGAATFYRHGGRLTYSHAGDRTDMRRRYPGAVRFVLWRAIQLAIRERMLEMDLAGVDILGARRVPVEGDEMYGLYAFKRSFGARWIELTGNHERVTGPLRYALGRVTGRLPLPAPLRGGAVSGRAGPR